MSRGRVQTRPLSVMESTPQLGHAAAVSSAVTTCTTRPPNASDATRSTASRPGRADARRPIPDPFEHGEFAYAETSPWPHFDHEYCLDNSHDHEVRGVLRQRPRPELPR